MLTMEALPCHAEGGVSKAAFVPVVPTTSVAVAVLPAVNVTLLLLNPQEALVGAPVQVRLTVPL